MIREQLQRLADPKFQQFSSSLIPNINSDLVIGVKLPKLRKIAKQIVKQDWKAYLKNASDESFEEVMLQGMIIGYLNIDLEEKLNYISSFIPKIDNWSTCDSFCAGLKIAKDYPDKVWDFILPYLKCNKEYHIRFGIVMLIYYYTSERYIDEALQLLDSIKVHTYYVQMAIAWSVSIFYKKVPDQTLLYLKKNNLDDFTYNKSLQKIIESLQVNTKEKDLIRSMKRK